MTILHFPVQKLCSISRDSNDLLLAATGTYIQSLSLNSNELSSVWPRDQIEYSSDAESEIESRPAKRLKLDTGDKLSSGRETSEASEASIDIKVEGKPRQKGERRKPKIPDTSLPHVSHLTATADGQHAIAITAEDKAIRVFKVSGNGKLHQLSCRVMPKKSCAVILSPDETTILTADKFGDVYAIPLHPEAEYQRKSPVAQPEESFKPSATELTVHTKGNLEALRQQQLQKQKHSRKGGPDFEHKLLLGHVSLLTDLAIATGGINGKERSFVLTSDRDEHIRVSRGIPQTHVIHSFCLGHNEFVSKLCVVPWDRKVLIAGNGEPSLRVYDWQTGEEHTRYNLLEHLRDAIEDVLGAERSTEKLAVSGIWPISSVGASAADHDKYALVVALEALPLLFTFQLSNFGLRHLQTLKLDSNILDVLHLRKQNVVAVSVDTAHQPGSNKEYRTEAESACEALKFYGIGHGEVLSNTLPIQGVYLQPSHDVTVNVELMPIQETEDKRHENETAARAKYEKTYSVLGELIYGLENLRKRRGKAAEEEDDAVAESEGELEGAPDLDKVTT